MYQHAATQQTFQTLSSPGRNACASEHNPGLDRSDSLLFLSSWRASSPDLAEPLAWKEERTWASRCREIFVSRESPLAILMVSMVMMISMPCQPGSLLPLILGPVCIVAGAGSAISISAYCETLVARVSQRHDFGALHAHVHGYMYHPCVSTSSILRSLETMIPFRKHGPNPTSRLHQLIHDPTPIAFLAACVVYWTTISIYYHLHRHNKYQNHFLAGGIGSAFILGWVFGRDVRGVLMDLTPWLVLIALVLSAGLHWVMGIQGAHRAVEVEFVPDEKRGPLLC